MAESTLIYNACIITPIGVWERGWLLTDAHRIGLMGQGTPPEFTAASNIDATSHTLLPGFIDVHVHGAMGHDARDASPDGLRAMAKFFAQHGVTSFLATTWTDSRQRITAALENIAELQGAQPDGSTILGAHLEGPYLNISKCGAQNPSYIRTASQEEALSFLDLGVIRLLSVAPEYPENHWLIKECIQRGITVSAAHTAATYEDIQAAVQMGLTHATHTYNAMVGLGHREPGTVGAVLTMPEIRCELIADNIHVHPAAMKLLYAAKGVNGVVLITDAIRAAGMPEGDYPLDERTITVRDDAVRLPDGSLAGSVLTMNRGVCNFIQAVEQPIDVIWPTTSLNAARAARVADRKGSLEVGKDADLVLVDNAVNVYLTIVEGRIVYRNLP